MSLLVLLSKEYISHSQREAKDILPTKLTYILLCKYSHFSFRSSLACFLFVSSYGKFVRFFYYYYIIIMFGIKICFILCSFSFFGVRCVCVCASVLMIMMRIECVSHVIFCTFFRICFKLFSPFHCPPLYCIIFLSEFGNVAHPNEFE